MKVFGGIDIGGTSIKCAMCDSSGSILNTTSFSTESNTTDFNIAMQKIAEWFLKLQVSNRFELEGIGVGCTGPVNRNTGVIENPYTLQGWENYSLIQSLENLTSVPVIVENDGNAALYGELCKHKPNIVNAIMLTFGTGIGLSIFLGSKFYRLPDDFHPEAGHLAVGVDSPFTCYCGKKKCFENILSGNAINRDAKYFFNKLPEDILKNPESEEANFFTSRLADALEEIIVNLAIFFHPEIVIIGGGIQEILMNSVVDIVQDRIEHLKKMYGGVKIEPALLGEKAGVIGSAFLIVHYLQEKNNDTVQS